MTAQVPTLAELIKLAIDTRLADTHTALVGEVKSFDETTQTVSVQPVVKSVLLDRDGGRLVEDLPLLTSVPVAFPRAGGYFLSVPLEAGDTVLLICAETAIAKWRETGRTQEAPAEIRNHDLSDAIAIPGIFAGTSPLADVSTDSMILGKDGGLQIKIDDGASLIHLGDPTGTDFLVRLTALTTQLTILQAAYDLHVHPFPAPSGPPTGVPAVLLTPAWPGALLGTTKTKAE